MTNIHRLVHRFFGIGLLSAAAIAPHTAGAQMFNEAWSFAPQNRASIAALMKSVESGSNNGNIAGVDGASSITNLVCGSDGSSSASANSSCIILNNANGGLNIGQDSTGDQSATTTTTSTTTVDETINVAEQGGADEVLETLNGS